MSNYIPHETIKCDDRGTPSVSSNKVKLFN